MPSIQAMRKSVSAAAAPALYENLIALAGKNAGPASKPEQAES
jgi:hypothetical protein